MKYFYDLHIHTLLSACADVEMTPQNIVNMALLKNLDFIAITDHNTNRNVDAVITAANILNSAIVVIPAMELETCEGIHIVCLFEDNESATRFSDYVFAHMPVQDNDTNRYGEQTLVDAYDNAIGEIDRQLVISTDISINGIVELLASYNGLAIASHIDKESHSILSKLGSISSSHNFTTLEVTPRVNANLLDQLLKEGYHIIVNSDSHYLGDINERENNFLDLEEKSVQCLIHTLSNKRNTK